MADTRGSGPRAERRKGSSPFSGKIARNAQTKTEMGLEQIDPMSNGLIYV